jgi:hypothetical protein
LLWCGIQRKSGTGAKRVSSSPDATAVSMALLYYHLEILSRRSKKEKQALKTIYKYRRIIPKNGVLFCA